MDPLQRTFKMYPNFNCWVHCGQVLSVPTMYSPCAHQVYGSLSPVSTTRGTLITTRWRMLVPPRGSLRNSPSKTSWPQVTLLLVGNWNGSLWLFITRCRWIDAPRNGIVETTKVLGMRWLTPVGNWWVSLVLGYTTRWWMSKRPWVTQHLCLYHRHWLTFLIGSGGDEEVEWPDGHPAFSAWTDWEPWG